MTTQINTYAAVNELESLLLSENLIRFVFEHTHTLTVERLEEVDGNATTLYDLKPIDNDTDGYMITGMSAVFLCAYICKADPFFKVDITEPFVNAFDKFISSHGLVNHYKATESFEPLITRNVLAREIKIYPAMHEWYVSFLKNIYQVIDLLESL